MMKDFITFERKTCRTYFLPSYRNPISAIYSTAVILFGEETLPLMILSFMIVDNSVTSFFEVFVFTE